MCTVQKAIRDNPALADEIVELITDRSIEREAAANVLGKRKIDVSAGTISRHRLNNCETCKKRGVMW